MPTFNWNDIDETDIPTREPLPNGEYLIKVKDIEEKWTRNGDAEMWNLTMVVMCGEHKDRYIWDRWIFKGGALGIIKKACKELGFILDGEYNLAKSDIIGLSCFIKTELETYTDRNGNERQKAQVKYYRSAGESDLNSIDSPSPVHLEEECPF